MHRALTLSEILTSIGYFLPPSALLACAQCCHSFHAAFIPLLWHSPAFHCRKPQCLPSGPLLLQHQHRIHHLSLNICSSLSPSAFQSCVNLSHLSLNLPHPALHDSNSWGPWRSLISHHYKSLRHITATIHALHEEAMPPEFCAAIASCLDLQTLTLQGHLIQPQDRGKALNELWRALLDLDTLRLKNISLPTRPTSTKPGNDIRLSRLRHIFVDEPRQGAAGEDGVDLLMRFPDLRSLYWRSSPADYYNQSNCLPLQRLGLAFLAGHWPQLEDLDFKGADVKDYDLAMILEGITRLMNLRVVNTAFGPSAMDAIAKHYLSIKILDLTKCPYVKSSMVQTFLSSMPGLEYLSAYKLNCLDTVNGPPWVSLNLQHLIICIDMSTSQDKATPPGQDQTLHSGKRPLRYSSTARLPAPPDPDATPRSYSATGLPQKAQQVETNPGSYLGCRSGIALHPERPTFLHFLERPSRHGSGRNPLDHRLLARLANLGRPTHARSISLLRAEANSEPDPYPCL